MNNIVDISIGGGSQIVWVSGFTNILTSGYYIKNSINEGSINITTASTGNLYVAGFVNRNLSGDLHNQDGQTRPKATIGIMNSINMANIETLSTSTGRTFIGGLVTLNGGTDGGSIQDAVNTGNIIGRNSNSSSQADPGVGTEAQGAVITSYNSGVTVAGIAAMAVYGRSRIYDTSNKGDVIGIANKFVRSGGVLGSALSQESSSAGLTANTHYSSATNAPHAIGLSIISNGINYGDVQAITEKIGSYGSVSNTNQTVYFRRNDSGTNATDILLGFPSGGTSLPTRTSTNVRPGVYSAAGGVIGYGLSKMFRMVNHGNIAATDVAGGVVGATSVVTSTTVFINTAINYGDIRAINNENYTNVYNNKKALEAHFYATNHSFLYPSTRTDIRLMPENKRGFGGVFGRLQRGSGQTMTSVNGSFDFVVNMNPNIDLIGRLDQVYDFSSSSRFFIFVDAIYYSAKVNDTTQVVFTGYEYERRGTSNATFEIRNFQYQYSTDDEGYPLYRVRMTGGNRYVPRGTQNQNITVVYKKIGNRDLDEDYRIVTSSPDYGNTSRYTNTTIAAGSWSDWMFDDGGAKPAQTNTITGTMSYQNGTTSYFNGAYKVNEITENPAEATSTRKYVYNPYFEMRDESTTLDDLQPITSYIYYAENDLLATQFVDKRPNGMYVLSSSSGSNYGAVLPKNFDVNKLKKIDYDVPNFLNYENVNEDYLIGELASSFGNLFDAYESLYQTKYNDKSELLNEGQSLKIKDKNYPTEVFYESNNFTGNTITFVVNRDLINPANSFTLNFELLKAVIPEGALIASSSATQAQLEAFRNNNLNAIIATGVIAPDLSFTASNRGQVVGQTITLGTFTSYSEAAIHDNAFTSVYSTEYTVRLQVLNTNVSNPTLNALRLDGGSYSNSNMGSRKTITNSIGMRFNDGSSKFPNGYAIDEFIKVYYEGDNDYEVLNDYYTIVSVPKAATQFVTDIYFSNELRPGNYKIGYKYYENDTEKFVYVNYDPAITRDFTEFVPYTSKNYDGSTADFNFNYDITSIHGFTMNRTVNTEGIPIYLNGYYDYEVSFLDRFVKTEFFEFDNITTSSSIVDGYRRYTINFREGNTTRVTKYIEERTLSPNYYKDNSSIPKTYNAGLGVDVTTTTATREANTTIFSLDYKLPLSFYDYDNFLITYTYNGGISEEVTDSTNLIYSEVSERLNLVMTKDALPGTYVITVKYVRDGIEINAGRVTVTKNPGTSGYLTNIKFSRFVVGNEYPDINVVNSTNTTIDPSPKYNLGVYYNGINYSEADIDGKTYFRIDGTVERIPLNYYMPVNITDYLPLGAMIKRKIYTSPSTFIWSDLVDANNTPEEIQAALATDFTIDPKTGAFTEEDVYIEYMVVPENEKDKPTNSQTGITYFISVKDISFTFLTMFNFWYKDSSNNITKLDDILAFDETLILLSMYNYEVSKDGVVLEDTIPENNISSIEFDKLEKVNSKVNMFYYIDFNTKNDYLYQIGNNLSGFYKITLGLPKNYTYKIYIDNYDTEDNLLPKFSDYMDDIEGFFYYINSSPITRTRYFHVVVEYNELDETDWGFTDIYNSWD